jgi:hypothetical protein
LNSSADLRKTSLSVKHFLNYLIGIVAVAVVSCDPSDESSPVEKDFYPLQKGWYQLYQVEEITYELNVPETLAYELKTVVVDSFRNSEGVYTYVIHRSKRPEGETSWTYTDTWSAVLDRKELVVSEGNVPFVKLRFPAEQGKQWDGNTYNNIIDPSNEHEDLYTIDEAGNSLMVGDQEFGEYARVTQEDNQEFIVFFDKRLETYARDIGLIYKETHQLHYCTQDDCLGQQIVEQGVIYKQTIKGYGVE